MIPGQFDYHSPASLDEALALLSQNEDAKILAGGQSLIPAMRFRLALPEILIDINGLHDLAYIRETDGYLAIGAMTRESALEESTVVQSRYPLLADTARVIADPLVRNMATLGGNLAHADPANDHPATMLAYGAQIVARGPDGERVIEVDDFFVDLFENSLAANEILTEVRIPVPGPGAGGAYVKVERKVGDYAISAVAVQLTLAGDTCTAARVGLTNVSPVPIRSTAAEEALIGSNLDAPTLEAAGAAAAAASDPSPDLRGSVKYKRDLTRILTKRVVAKAAERAKEDGMSRHTIKVQVNGEEHTAEVDARTLLVHFIRENLDLTGTHIGCDTTSCGACTVLLDGRAVKSCTVFAVQANGRSVQTIEGLANGDLHPLQEGFWEKHGLQCGYCTPGMILSAKHLLDKNPSPSEEEIRWGISGNLCRCTGYNKIVEAIQYAADKLQAGATEEAES